MEKHRNLSLNYHQIPTLSRSVALMCTTFSYKPNGKFLVTYFNIDVQENVLERPGVLGWGMEHVQYFLLLGIDVI